MTHNINSQINRKYVVVINRYHNLITMIQETEMIIIIVGNVSFQAAGMRFTTRNIHYKLQAHYGTAAVRAAYEEYGAEVLAKYKNMEVVIAGTSFCTSYFCHPCIQF